MEQTNISQNTCVDCGAVLHSTRRDRCLPCQMKISRQRGMALPDEASCCHCGEQRSALLRWGLLGQTQVVICHNCRQLAMRLKPAPESVREMEARLQRDVWSREDRVAFLHGTGERNPHVEELAQELDALAEELLGA